MAGLRGLRPANRFLCRRVDCVGCVAIRYGGIVMTARQIITARLGRGLGPLAAMPRDLRRALYLLALQLNRKEAP